MKTVTLIILSSAFALLLPFVGFGQAKRISDDVYYTALHAAELKTNEQIRKEVQIQRLYKDGETIATLTGTSEYLPPDKSRWFYVENRGNVVKKIEVITIGSVDFRKENDGEWVKKDSNSSSLGISGKDNSKREFFQENVTIGNEGFLVLIEKKVNANTTYFDETKTWIDSKGRMAKSISTTSLLDPKNIVSLVEVIYEYNLKPPKIEAPIR